MLCLVLRHPPVNAICFISSLKFHRLYLNGNGAVTMTFSENNTRYFQDNYCMMHFLSHYHGFSRYIANVPGQFICIIHICIEL